MKTRAKLFGCLLLLCSGPGLAAEAAPPVLRFPDGISWKAVFDAGFRPKHIPGLERKMTECKTQPLRFELEGSTEPFILDPGRLSIELMFDDGVRHFMHTSHVPVTMEEGERRLEKFREMFKGHLVRRGSMPPVMDERTGSVMTTGEQFAVAKIDNHVFYFGFNASAQKERPLLPRFQLGWHPSPGEDSPPIRRKIVTPPAGYEWYSLDPKVHTPDPGSEAEAEKVDPLPEATGRPERGPRGETAESPQPSYAPVEAAGPRRWGGWILLALAGLGFVVWRWTRRSV
jgi:hypothetical protein